MILERLEHRLTVCKTASVGEIGTDGGFFFLAKTDGEISLVCPTEDVPEKTVAREDGWRAFRVRGPLEFGLVGILSRLTGVLAERGIGIFAVSTYDTDYILVKEEAFDIAADALTRAGYEVV